MINANNIEQVLGVLIQAHGLYTDTRLAPVTITIASREPGEFLTKTYIGVYEYISDTLVALVDSNGLIYKLSAIEGGEA